MDETTPVTEPSTATKAKPTLRFIVQEQENTGYSTRWVDLHGLLASEREAERFIQRRGIAGQYRIVREVRIVQATPASTMDLATVPFAEPEPQPANANG